jgi:uncharacterized protein (TIGR02145 family)
MAKIFFIKMLLLIVSLNLPVNLLGQTYQPGDYITLNALEYTSGELQWQYSYDNIDWNDIPGATGLTHVFYPAVNTFLRLKITDPECPPFYYTETKYIELVGEFQCGSILVDPRDLQTYTTIEIGNQCWMAKNLNVGVMILGASNQNDPEVIEKYCYENNPENCEVYGGLYQWNQVMDYSNIENAQGICPPGWYVPGDDEWKTLEIELGMSESDANLTGFRGFGVGTTLMAGGSSGFEALFGGARTQNGGWLYIEGSGSYEYGYFHTSTEAENNSFAFRRCLTSSSTGIGRFDTWPKTYGLSVRCLKEE